MAAPDRLAAALTERKDEVRVLNRSLAAILAVVVFGIFPAAARAVKPRISNAAQPRVDRACTHAEKSGLPIRPTTTTG